MLASEIDVRNNDELKMIVDEAIARFGGIDILVNKTSAPCFNNSLNTSAEQFDLIMSTSVRAAFFLSKNTLSILEKSSIPNATQKLDLGRAKAPPLILAITNKSIFSF